MAFDLSKAKRIAPSLLPTRLGAGRTPLLLPAARPRYSLDCPLRPAKAPTPWPAPFFSGPPAGGPWIFPSFWAAQRDGRHLWCRLPVGLGSFSCGAGTAQPPCCFPHHKVGNVGKTAISNFGFGMRMEVGLKKCCNPRVSILRLSSRACGPRQRRRPRARPGPCEAAVLTRKSGTVGKTASSGF